MKNIKSYLLLITIAVISACNSVSTPAPEPKGTLHIETAIIYAIGGVQPVAREDFYLLDTDLISILKQVEPNRKEDELLGNLGLAYKLHNAEKHFAAIQQHAKYKVTTDLQGKAQFQNVEPNTYYLYGITSTRSGAAIWNLKTTVKAGQNSEILDSKNTGFIF